jgi:hypothetical protein
MTPSRHRTGWVRPACPLYEGPKGGEAASALPLARAYPSAISGHARQGARGRRGGADRADGPVTQAAIASKLAARIYGGAVLLEAIQDDPEKYTHFVVLAWEAGPPEAASKTSVVFTLKSVPGALYRALAPFALRGVDLAKIESRPLRENPGNTSSTWTFSEIPGRREGRRSQNSRSSPGNSACWATILTG